MAYLTRRELLKLTTMLGGSAVFSSCSIDAHPKPDTVFPQPGPDQLEAVYAENFSIDSRFWNNRTKGIIRHWIPHCYNKLSDPDLIEGGIDNFVQAGKKLKQQTAKGHVGLELSNAYVLNTVEAMCNALMINPQGDSEIETAQSAMRVKLDEWIPIILSAQEQDGYLQTWTTLGSHRRWSNRNAHEGYVAGYFIEAAIAHYRMSGKTDTTLYDAAKRLANCWCDNIGPLPKETWWDGHQEIEQALTKFGQFINGNEGPGKGDNYIGLAKFLLDARTGGSEYDQSHTFPVNQTTAVGHATRAVYMYSGMTDIANLTKDQNYLNAVNQLWDNLVNRKMYLTGGIGSNRHNEGFDPDYTLPNNNYCESCAACGMLFFQHRLNLTYQNSKYADLMELVLYNALLGSLDIEAKNYTHTNPLTQIFSRYSWHTSPCCAGNISRTLLALPTWMYAKSKKSLAINLFIGSKVQINDLAGTDVEIIQNTNYPWNGKVVVKVNPSTPSEFTILIRKPSRDVSTCYKFTPEQNGITSISVNGSIIEPDELNGYAAITRIWQSGDRIELVLPLVIQRIRSIQNVESTRNRVAIKYGALVYNFETADIDIDSHPALSPSIPLSAEWATNLFDGLIVVKGTSENGTIFSAIPNYARNNRGGKSTVWILERSLPELLAWYKLDEGSGTVLRDTTNNSKEATLNNGASWVEGRSNFAVKLDGISSYISLPAGILADLCNFTIAVWVNPDAINYWVRIFDFGFDTGTNMFLTARSQTDNLRLAITTNGPQAQQQINSSKLLTIGVWQHIAVTRSGNLGIIYIDGAEVARNEQFFMAPSDMGPTTNNYIGKSQYPDPYFKGLVEDFRIYSKALTTSEIVKILS